MVTRKTTTLAAAIALGTLLPLAALRPVARAEAPAAPATPTGKIDPQVKSLLAQMAAAYQGLQTYSGTEVAEGSEAMGMPYTMDFHYQRPGQMAFTVTRSHGGKPETSRLLLDGHALYVASSQTPGRYIHQTTPQKSYTLPLDALIIKADVKNPIMIDLLENGAKLLEGLGQDPHTTMTLGAPDTVDGMAVDTILVNAEYPSGQKSSGAFLIGRKDHLLRRVTDTSAGPNQPPMTQTQTFLHVQANPALPASMFVWTPPAGAVAVETGPGGAKADPAAVTLLTRMYAAYDALKSYSCTMNTTDGLRAEFAIQKPYKVACVRTSNQGVTKAVSDGSNLYVTTTESSGPRMTPIPTRYLKLPILPNDWNTGLYLSRFGNLPQYIPTMDFMPNVVLKAVTMPADSYDWKMGKPGVVNGEPVDTVTLRRDDGSSDICIVMTLSISPKDHFLRQVSEDSQISSQPPSRRTETYTNIHINPALPASLFVFTPPPGSVPVTMAADLEARR